MSEQDIWELHLKAALLLLREFRYKAVAQKIDPRAVRVALKYGLLVDDYLSVQHGLSREEEKRLIILAKKLFKETPK
jgi:hypothetical protein